MYLSAYIANIEPIHKGYVAIVEDYHKRQYYGEADRSIIPFSLLEQRVASTEVKENTLTIYVERGN